MSDRPLRHEPGGMTVDAIRSRYDEMIARKDECEECDFLLDVGVLLTELTAERERTDALVKEIATAMLLASTLPWLSKRLREALDRWEFVGSPVSPRPKE